MGESELDSSRSRSAAYEVRGSLPGFMRKIYTLFTELSCRARYYFSYGLNFRELHDALQAQQRPDKETESTLNHETRPVK
jgi:hypothetical protein